MSITTLKAVLRELERRLEFTPMAVQEAVGVEDKHYALGSEAMLAGLVNELRAVEAYTRGDPWPIQCGTLLRDAFLGLKPVEPKPVACRPILLTSNTQWGFYGTWARAVTGIRVEVAWAAAFRSLHALSMNGSTVRDWLDSSRGRRFADSVIDAVMDGESLSKAVAREADTVPAALHPAHHARVFDKGTT